MNVRLIDIVKPVEALSPAALTGAAGDGDYLNMKFVDKVQIILAVNNATTVTGGAVTLLQATDNAGTSAKALAFDTMWANTDTGASDTLVETTVASDTFTTDTTDNKDLLYVIEVKADDLDVNNSFTHVALHVDSMANAVGSATYIAHCQRYSPAIDLTMTD